MGSQVIKNFSEIVEVTPVIDTAAYATGDRLGSIMTVANAVKIDGERRGCVLESIVILDKAKQSLDIDVLLFRELPTVASADNAAIDITDAEMEKCLGVVSLVAADYVALANSSVATKRGIGLTLKPAANADLSTQSNLFALLVARGAPTYGSTSAIVVKFGILQD